MKLKDYLLLSLIFAAIAAVAVFFTVKVVKETTPALPEIVKVEEVNKATPRSQSNQVCNVFVFDAAANCAVGSKIVFTPLRWGNDQLPIFFAGQFCDLNYAVVSNNGGVTCIKAAPYKNLKLKITIKRIMLVKMKRVKLIRTLLRTMSRKMLRQTN